MLKSLKKLSKYLNGDKEEDTKEKKESTKRDAKKTRTKSKEKTNLINTINCQHHLGYLNQHSKTKEIPDECMVCTQLLECLQSSPK